MYELVKRVDFSKEKQSRKRLSKKLFIEWLNRNYPDVNTVDTIFFRCNIYWKQSIFGT